MYTSYGDPNTPTAAEPTNVAPFVAPNTPAMPYMTNANIDQHHMTPLPPRMAHTSSPSIPAQQQPPSHSHVHGSPSAAAAGTTPPPGGSLPQHTPSWPIEGIEPRIYPGMISRRQRAGSLRKSSTHESDERLSTRTAVEETYAEEDEEAE